MASDVRSVSPQNYPQMQMPSLCAKRSLVIVAVALAVITVVGIIWCLTPLKPSFIAINLTACAVSTSITGLFTLFLLSKCYQWRDKPVIIEEKPVEQGSPSRAPFPLLQPESEPEAVISETPVVIPTSAEIKDQVISHFNRALNPQDLEEHRDLAAYIVGKFFPENVFTSLTMSGDIYTVQLKGNNNEIPAGTLIDRQELLEPITGLVGKLGEIDKNANNKLSHSYVVLGKEISFKVRDNTIYFLNKDKMERNTTDHLGMAHEMNFQIFPSCDVLCSTAPALLQFLAKTYLGENGHLRVAPVSISFDPETNRVEMLNIADLSVPRLIGKSKFQDEVNKPNVHFQKKETFKLTIATLSYS